MHDMLRTQVINRSYSREQRLQALVEMIFDRHGLDLQYDADATLTVSEIWQQRRANCLAFTLMFVALAREAGIQARVQEVGQVVSWYQDQAQGLVYSVGHVNAGSASPTASPRSTWTATCCTTAVGRCRSARHGPWLTSTTTVAPNAWPAAI